jgi:transcriptional regulator with XRE-family HTH domain
MAKKTARLLPSTEARLQQLGERLRLARLRRKLTSKQVAERSGMTVVTLRNLERGASGVTIGAYLAVMQVLGIEQDIDLVAKDDLQGRTLQDAQLSRRTRVETPPVPALSNQPSIGKRAAVKAKLPASTSPTPESYWIAGSEFVSADALADLIQPPSAPVRRKKRRKR